MPQKRSQGFKSWKRGKPLLVVVDMQDGFPAARDPSLIRRINARLRKLVGWQVVFLCYRECGKLTTERTPGSATIWKANDDGSDELMAFIAGLGAFPPEVEFWGVNTMACVLQTAMGVATRFREGGFDKVPIRINSIYCGDQSDLAAVQFTRSTK